MAAAQVELRRAQSLLSSDQETSIGILHGLVKRDVQNGDEEAIRIKEQSILELGGLLAKTGQAAGGNSMRPDVTTPQADSGHEPLKRFVPYYRDNRAELSSALMVPINYRVF
uniref:Uncharacterized protein n=1 Tax=Eptatretus burgeri TaxID=7764 RepID=A0A8C4QPY7_EPTBU